LLDNSDRLDHDEVVSFSAIAALIATAVALGAAGAAVWLIVSAFADAERTRESAAWPAVPGTVTASKVDSFTSEGRRTYIPSIAYSYQYEGRSLEGREVRIGGMITTEEIAGQIVRSHPVGAEVPVFVDPADPSRAVLQPALPGTFLMRPFFAIGGGLVLFVAIFFALIAVSAAAVAPGLIVLVPSGLLAASVWCVIGGVLVIVKYARRRAHHSAAAWPRAAGVITESAVVPAPSVDGGAYAVPRIAYRYSASGADRIGRRISFAPALMTLTDAERVVALYAVGTAVNVFRHPTDIAIAVIDPSPPPSFLAYATVCGLGLIAIGVAAAVAPLLYLGVQLFAAR